MPTTITPPTVADGTLSAAYTTATNDTFIGQVAVAVSLVAGMVLSEDPAAYPDDLVRKKLANVANNNPAAYSRQMFTYAVLSDLVTTSSSSDTDIIARVTDVWSNLAAQYAT